MNVRPLSFTYRILVVLCLQFALFPFISIGQKYADKDYYLVDSMELDQLTKLDRALVDSSLRVYHSSPNDTLRLQALNAIVEASWDDNVWPKYNAIVLEKVTELLDAYESGTGEKLTGDERKGLLALKASALNNEGFFFKNQYKYDVALERFEASLTISRKIGNKDLVASALNNIGHIYKTKGKIVDAIDYYEKSLEIKRELDDQSGIATTLNNIGVVYRNVGDVPKALEYYFRSLKILERMEDKHNEAVLLSNIGIIYENQGEIQSAIKYYKKSLAIERDIEDKRGEAISLNHLASLYAKQGDTTSAIDYFTKSLKLNKDVNDQDGVASTISSIGTLFFEVGETQKALDKFTESLSIQEKIGDSIGLTTSLNNLAKTYIELGDLSKAKRYANNSLRLAKKLGFPNKIRHAANVLGEIYQQEHDWKKAFEMHVLEIEMRDSVRGQDIEKDLLRQQTNYEIDKREHEIEVLTAQNSLLEKDKEVKDLKLMQNRMVGILLIFGFALVLIVVLVVYRGLKRQRIVNGLLKSQRDEESRKNEEKNTMLKEVHHRVKNNLQVVISLLRYQAIEIDDEDVLEKLNNMQSRILTMSRIHEKMYRTDDLRHVDTQEYFSSLVKDLVNSYAVGKEISMSIRIEDVQLEIKTMVPLGLIINEMVSNSLKHAFEGRKEGEIILELRSLGNNKYEMIIGDDGIGIKGGEGSSGLGHELIEIFTEQLNGTIERLNRPGTVYKVEFEGIDINI